MWWRLTWPSTSPRCEDCLIGQVYIPTTSHKVTGKTRKPGRWRGTSNGKTRKPGRWRGTSNGKTRKPGRWRGTSNG
ncbi:uncharacterized protein LOC108208422 isoform X2 [Daucus carota subsp. sativus]|uniref:uncharacterized protein LOC108208422 isoform X2 n=1 Tax=Daucus carota subsp. sativus TaxID=79200 RepID=UPI0007EF4C1F|nr:PREDICTED: uncharacterized protein LOC108208422 isoform X2 [Daucus carota subsp. sativus]